MAVKIRLSVVGKKNAPVYKIVVANSKNKRDGEYLDNIGTYLPSTGQIVQFHADKLEGWVAKGAQLTDTVKRIAKLHKRQQQTPTIKVDAVKKAKIKPAPEKVEAAVEAVVAE